MDIPDGYDIPNGGSGVCVALAPQCAVEADQGIVGKPGELRLPEANGPAITKTLPKVAACFRVSRATSIAFISEVLYPSESIRNPIDRKGPPRLTNSMCPAITTYINMEYFWGGGNECTYTRTNV